MTPPSLRLVIFDCDGVLVDSETPSNRVVAEEITRLGWPLSTEESLSCFMGASLSSMVPTIEAHTGRPVPTGWVDRLVERLVDVLGREVEPMPGAAELLRAVSSLGLPYRVASNSSHEDSLPGVRAAISAGMACIGLDPRGDAPLLRAAGAVVVRELAEVPALLRAGLRGAA